MFVRYFDNVDSAMSVIGFLSERSKVSNPVSTQGLQNRTHHSVVASWHITVDDSELMFTIPLSPLLER